LVLFALVAACSSRRSEQTPAPVESVDAAPPATAPPPPSCAADSDCVPLDCCYAAGETSCMPKVRSNCDKFVVECKDTAGPRYTCACDKGACVGKYTMGSAPAPGTPPAPGAAPFGDQTSIASGELSSSAVLAVIMKHGGDVRACHAKTKKTAGLATYSWNVAKSGTVEKPTAISTTGLDPKLTACLTKKIGAWRFPKAKGPTRVTYGFRFTKT
jgi:hypothetical protein